MTEQRSTIATQAVVVATRGTTAVYARADQDGALRLKQFVRGPPECADLAELPRVVDEHGDPIRALIVRSAPLAPQTHLLVRPLALLRGLSESPVVVAVPIVDDLLGEVEIARLRPDLERIVRAEAGLAYGQSGWTWSGPSEAASFVNEATARAARVRGGRRAVSGWAAVAESGRGASVAESQVGRLPARFQEFVREQLGEQERIVAFIHRPQSRARRLFGAPTREALLVISDEQFLWLEEIRPLGADLQTWGYDARTMPLERVGSVDVAAGSEIQRIAVTSDVGGEALVAEVPAAAIALVGDVREHLNRFLAKERRLPRRIYRPAERADPLVLPEGWPDAEAVGRGLYAELCEARGAPPLVAAYLVPARMKGEARGLLAIYPSDLVYLPAPGEKAQDETHPLASVAWVEMRRSVLPSQLTIVGTGRRTWSSATTAPLLALFRPLRQLAANASGISAIS